MSLTTVALRVGCMLLVACQAEPPLPEPVPADPLWPVVSQMLGARCGSLDCHGQTARPLRLYHRHGLRLDAANQPGEGNTTAAEHDANLRATLALEPELTATVFADDGRDPERLTLVRKALGLEKHKGEAALGIGSAADRCLRSWLKGATDEALCLEGTRLERQEP